MSYDSDMRGRYYIIPHPLTTPQKENPLAEYSSSCVCVRILNSYCARKRAQEKEIWLLKGEAQLLEAR